MSPQELFDEAVRLEDEGQLELALPLWRQIVESHPTRNAFLRLGGITKELGLLSDAESAFKRALEIAPRSALARMHLGILAIGRRDYETAEAYLKEACDIKEDPGGFSLLGVALRNNRKPAEAEEAYRNALRIDPRYEEAYFNLGVLLRFERPAEAQAAFRAALELDPTFGCAHRELGHLLIRHGANPETERHLRKAIELGPRDAWAHVYLGTYLWINADTDGAMAEFREAARLEPEWSVPLWSLGNIYENVLKDFDSAQSLFERALELEPDSREALKNLGRLSKKRGRTDLAKEYLRRALLLDPDNQRVLALLRDVDRNASP